MIAKNGRGDKNRSESAEAAVRIARYKRTSKACFRREVHERVKEAGLLIQLGVLQAASWDVCDWRIPAPQR